MENDSEIIEALIEKYILPHLSNDELLKNKVEKLIYDVIPCMNPELDLDHNARVKLMMSAMNLYDGSLTSIFEMHGVKKDASDVSGNIEFAAVSYIAVFIIKSIGLSIVNIKKRLLEIEKTSKKLIKLLEMDSEILTLVGGLASNDIKPIFMNPENVEMDTSSFESSLTVRVLNAHKDLEYLTLVQSKFAESWVAKWLQYGKSGPKENSALNVWITTMAEIWVGELGRTLSFPKNTHSGRNQFLMFAEECMWEIQPTIGTDTIRNAYEKLRAKGKLDYLVKN